MAERFSAPGPRAGRRSSAPPREAFGFIACALAQLGIRSALSGRDTLVVMSTGSGKSAIHQVAGMLIPGATVVVSPLISLQRDQIEAIDDELPGEAAALDGSVGEKERRRRLRDLTQRALRLPPRSERLGGQLLLGGRPGRA